jgi:hypothetical protein
VSVNGRDQATAILSGTDALAAAAEAAQDAWDLCRQVKEYRQQRVVAIEPSDVPFMDTGYALAEAAALAQVAQGLSVYAATVGKWAAR